MDSLIFAFLVVLSICAGLYAILLTYRLHARYRLSYLSTYFYYQIFVSVFGMYGILGQNIVKRVLLRQESSLRTTEIIGHFFIFLGIPFLILAWYMFIRLCREILEKKLSRAFTLGYYFILTFIFLAYGAAIVVLNFSKFQSDQFGHFSSVLMSMYAILQVPVIVIGLSQIFIHAKKVNDQMKRKALATFAGLNLLLFCPTGVYFLFANKNNALAAFYLLVFLSVNIPPVLYWRDYLRKHFIAPALERADAQTMRRFIEKYGISRREEEVIQQLCEGKTNKEISRALFISLQTVKDHVYRIYQKTDVKNRVQLINLIQSFQKKGEGVPGQ